MKPVNLVIKCEKLTLYQMTKSWTCPNLKHLQMTKLMPLKRLTVRNIVGKVENTGFPKFFLSSPKLISIYVSNLFCRLQVL